MLKALPPPSRPPSKAPAADYSLRVVWTVARYVEEHRGAQGLADLAKAGGVLPEHFDGRDHWVSAEAFEAIVACARAMMVDDDEFRRCCIHRMKEAYGPLRYALWAMTPAAVYAQAAKQYRLVSTSGDLVASGASANAITLTFTSRVPFSRLICVLRQHQSVVLPTMWGLPPAHLREEKCVGLGDERCELHYHWYATRRWLPMAFGAVLAGIAGWVLARWGLPYIPTPVALAFVGGAVGYLLEGRRADRMNERTRSEVMAALHAFANGETDARRELLDMHRRQKDWTRLVEEEMTARTVAIQHAVSGVQEVQSARATTLLGFSHDLRNPLQIISAATDYLAGVPALKSDPDAVESLGDMHQAIDRMRRMLGDLVRVTKAQREFVQMAPQVVAIPALTDGLRRRLRALVHGRDVRATVFATREAPEEVQIDPLALDRILDNLLTNAAKYTERGGVVVEVGGTPGFLVLKVSDTGCGIPADSLDRIFEPGGSSLRSRRGDSFGVGLSVVVQLLDQIGGRLEIMSRPGSGTTFWVYLPVVAQSERLSAVPEATGTDGPVRASRPPDRQQIVGGALRRVVTIRKLTA